VISRRAHKQDRRFGWYTKRLAVIFSFGYLVLFVAVPFISEIPAISGVGNRVLEASMPAAVAALPLMRIAHNTNDCARGSDSDPCSEVEDLGTALIVFLGWFQYFVIGLLSGALIDTSGSLKRRLLHQRSLT